MSLRIGARAGNDNRPRGGARAVRLVLATAFLALAGLTAQGCAGTAGTTEPKAESRVPSSCNGSAALCARRLGEVVFPATHNSYAASTEPGWHFANQRYPISRQLEDGIRGLLIDVHFGVPDAQANLVRTDLLAEGSDRNKVAQVIPPQALRVADQLAGRVGVGALSGTPKPYLCHTLCELGAEPLDQELGVIRSFLDSHPDQVLMVIVEDYVPPEVVEQAVEEAGLTKFVATLDRDAPLPTLGTLIERGERLVVFAEDHGGKPAWYMPAFSFIQDTPLGARLPTQLSCARARGEQGHPLLLINHWLETFPPLPIANRTIGGAGVLRSRITRCESDLGARGAIVAVDFYQQSAVVKVARELNEAPTDRHGG